MGIEQSVIDEIVRRVTDVVATNKIILFGSAAIGQMTPDSDIDLLILEKDIDDLREERLRIRRALRGLEYPFDIVVMTHERFEETKNLIGGVAYPANMQGKVIYEAA